MPVGGRKRGLFFPDNPVNYRIIEKDEVVMAKTLRVPNYPRHMPTGQAVVTSTVKTTLPGRLEDDGQQSQVHWSSRPHRRASEEIFARDCCQKN
jgi:hypothetical protein